MRTVQSCNILSLSALKFLNKLGEVMTATPVVEWQAGEATQDTETGMEAGLGHAVRNLAGLVDL